MLRTTAWGVARAGRCAAARGSLARRAQHGRLLCTATNTDGAHGDDGSDGSQLAGTDTRAAIHSSFAQRAADALRYEYFAQRAELEAEVEAAHMFRSLVESCKQQAMGFMELMEEYDDAEFGTTLNNLEIMADEERTLAEVRFQDAAGTAAREQLPHIKEWFEDLSDASARAANRLEFTASMLDAEVLEGEDDMERDEGVDGDDERAAPKR